MSWCCCALDEIDNRSRRDRPRVVVIGSGFGGLFAAKRLAKANAEVFVVAKTTHHLFQPLFYQVATGILSPGGGDCSIDARGPAHASKRFRASE
ncbi:MAG: FAD-dependent oxidoreductase [Actinomycetaceae bacterium]|nr:FAD-dependent oxidoreductase [Actinomycetaceae bacterium]